MLAIGDSFFDFHSDDESSIPHVAAAELGKTVANASVSGALLLEGDEAIPDQYVAGDWEWVIVDGGGNDVNDLCECGSCDEVMTAMISEDGASGVLPELVESIRSDGSSVAFVGYPDLPDGAEFGFARCGDELVELRERWAAMAALDDGVVFVDGSDAFTPSELENYEDDRVHPSVEGCDRLGRLVADAIVASGEAE